MIYRDQKTTCTSLGPPQSDYITEVTSSLKILRDHLSISIEFLEMHPVVLSAQELYTLSRKYLKYFPSFNASDRGHPAVTSHTLDQPSLFLNCRRGVLDVIAHMLHLQRGWQDVVSKESKHTTSLPRLSFWCVSELVDKERSMFVDKVLEER